MRRLVRILLIILLSIGCIWLLLFTPVDRTPYRDASFYQEMERSLDSLESAYVSDATGGPLYTGWSKVSITPFGKAPLAGYSNRSPKELEEIHDSIFVRTVIFKLGNKKAAVIAADLLIFHPEVTNAVHSLLPSNWGREELYLTTTHSHSSLGGWAPGVVGKAIAGKQNDTTVAFIARKIVESIQLAEARTKVSQIGLVENRLDDLVYNRLVNERGLVDPWLKSLIIDQGGETGIMNFFSAHATCLNSQWRSLSGDFPGLVNRMLEKDSIYDFSLYGAGAVGSMGPVAEGEGWERVSTLALNLEKEMDLLPMIANFRDASSLTSFHLNIPLRDPNVKISKDWAIRPYIFRMLAGDYPARISVLKIDQTVFVGIPADFSGELALPLYQKARELGLNLVITSFSGQYIGYVVRDEWYDLEKYESRSMSWYGPDNGSYLSEIIERILQIIA